jgi:hypothetical protein
MHTELSSHTEEQQAQNLARMLDAGRSEAMYTDAYKHIDKVISQDKGDSAYRILSRAAELEKPGVGLDLAIMVTTRPGSNCSYFNHYVGLDKKTVAGNGIEITDPYTYCAERERRHRLHVHWTRSLDRRRCPAAATADTRAAKARATKSSKR